MFAVVETRIGDGHVPGVRLCPAGQSREDVIAGLLRGMGTLDALLHDEQLRDYGTIVSGWSHGDTRTSVVRVKD